jgi:hypothetical protein
MADLLLRNNKTGGLEVYDISNNQLTGAAFIGTVGLDWQFAGIAPVHAAGASDLVLRNVNSGAFEVYDIAGNTLVGAASLGAVGLDWRLGGFAVDPPTDDASGGQLVQAMAAFGGGSGAADSLSTAPLGTDTSQQTFLTTPHACAGTVWSVGARCVASTCPSARRGASSVRRSPAGPTPPHQSPNVNHLALRHNPAVYPLCRPPGIVVWVNANY